MQKNWAQDKLGSKHTFVSAIIHVLYRKMFHSHHKDTNNPFTHID